VRPDMLRSLFFILFAFTVAACAGGGEGRDTVATLGGTETVGDDHDSSDPTAGTGDAGGICLLHNCESDDECEGCSEGRNTCYAEDKRCVECNPATGAGCAEGEVCTEFGRCVDPDLTCPTDDDGVPTVVCNDDPDCAACGPRNQVCAAGACVECRVDNEEACPGNQFCGPDNTCIPKCPQNCTSNADCSQCEGDGYAAKFCKNHRCAECASDNDCPTGQQCTIEGLCVEICGIPGPTPGTCLDDTDCAGCENTTNCVTPINGGHGSCSPMASGCSDLGESVVVLPAPFDQVTNTCSNDGDCDGVGILYNVGKLLREITGINSINDANIEYPMNACANVTVGTGTGSSLSCGVCVPCKQDADCLDLDINEVADEAFGPLGAIATALLLDALFGDGEHKIYMFCQNVAAGYGICVPCPSLINDCKSGGGGSGMCEHDVCTVGSPLDPSCGSCAASVCSVDDYCCNVEWDQVCVDAVDSLCAGSCNGNGGGCHDPCSTGPALNPACGPCVTQVCNQDAYCCNTEWDGICVGLVESLCGQDCSGGGGGCAHSECQQGGPLQADCSACATSVCNSDPFCCSTDWDALCVSHAESLCGNLCAGGGCAHSECQVGAPLDPNCSACAGAVCNQDSFCCTQQWDNICVGIAQNSGSCNC
jgi:hypothetical protein